MHVRQRQRAHTKYAKRPVCVRERERTRKARRERQSTNHVCRGQRRMPAVLLCLPLPYSFKRGFLTEPGGWLEATKHSNTPVFTTQNNNHSYFLAWVLGSKLRSSSFWSRGAPNLRVTSPAHMIWHAPGHTSMGFYHNTATSPSFPTRFKYLYHDFQILT